MGIKINDLLFLSEGYCFICKDEVYKKKYICNDCLKYFNIIDGIKYIEEKGCHYPYLYEGKLKELIHDFKFRDSIYLYRVFGELLLDYIIDKQLDFDVILPVPISKRKLYSRGYNQVDLMADYIGKKLNKKVIKDGIIKIKDTKDQHLISMKERNVNLRNSLKINNEKVFNNNKILILDDIVTSGNTLREIIRVLNKVEIYNMEALVIASAKKESNFKIDFKDI